MEQIPTINEADLHVTITKRYHGAWEVSIFYAGVPVKRYTIGELAGVLYVCILSSFPIIGFWLVSKTKREETLSHSYTSAINQFIDRIKMDVANSLWEGGNG